MEKCSYVSLKPYSIQVLTEYQKQLKKKCKVSTRDYKNKDKTSILYSIAK